MMAMDLPTKDECIELWKKYDMPDNIIQHTKIVTEIATAIAKALVKAGIDVDIDLVEKASLLHDVFKRCDFDDNTYNKVMDELVLQGIIKELPEKKIKHAELAGLYFAKDYPEMAKVIRNHNYMAITYGLDTWEDKILYYADKRVTHDNKVSLKHRLKELHKRYEIFFKKLSEIDRQQIAEIDKKIFALEEIIFSRLAIKPQDI